MRLFRREYLYNQTQNATQNVVERPAELSGKQVLNLNIAENERIFRSIFENSSDIVFRKIPIQRNSLLLIIYVDGLVDIKTLNEVVLQPLLSQGIGRDGRKPTRIRDVLSEHRVVYTDIESATMVSEIVYGVLKGSVAIMTDGLHEALMVNAQGFEKRGIDSPDNETSLRGPRDCFTETLRTNTSLVRRRIRNPNLKMESLVVGDHTQTDVVIAYLDGVVVHSVLAEVRRRLNDIPLKAVIDSGYIEEYIQDSPLSPWPQIQNTERPDVVTASLLEGKVAIFTDGTPFVLLVPFTFWAGLQTPDDYYERFEYSVFRRGIRYVMSLVTLTLPGAYVALTTYNPAMLPAPLMTSVATARETAPFPSVIETTLMELIFEGLQEAGIRLPSQMGPVISIVGALVIGEAAVRANIVSAPIVIVVALTGIASYGLPRYSFGLPFRMLRFGMLFMAGLFGLYGLAIGMGVVLVHLVCLESFGVPYFTPVSPLVFYHLRDVVFRTRRWKKS